MSEKMIAIQVPESAFRKLEQAAMLTYRSVDEVLVNTINTILIPPDGLPPNLANELAAMYLFSDKALWAATQPALSPTQQYRLQQLNHTAGERALTNAESLEQEALLDIYHYSILRRAQALAILTQRGHPIPDQLPHQGPIDDETEDSQTSA